MTMLSEGMFLGASAGAVSPTYIDSTWGQANSATSVTPSTPSGVVAGRLLVAIAICTTSGKTWSATGWSNIASISTTHSVAVLTKTATGSDSFTFSASGGSAALLVFVFVYSDATTVSANNLSGVSIANSATQTAASMSVTAGRALLASAWLNSSTATMSTPPSGMTLRDDQFVNNAPRGAVYEIINASTGASGAKTFVFSTNAQGGAFLLEIQ